MINKTLSITDYSFNDNIVEPLTLSIKIASSTIDICVLNTLQNNIVALESWTMPANNTFQKTPETLSKVFQSSEFFTKIFQKVWIISDHNNYTLVPEKLFEADKPIAYININYQLNSSDEIHVDTMKNIPVINVYCLSSEVNNGLRKAFPSLDYRHSISVLLNSILKEPNISTKIFAHFSYGRVDMLVVKENKLLFNNSFSFVSASDMIYFILNVYQQFHLSPMEIPIVLMGEIEKETSTFDIIYKYIRNVEFGERPVMLQYCEGIKELPKHLFYTLFHSFTCEL